MVVARDLCALIYAFVSIYGYNSRNAKAFIVIIPFYSVARDKRLRIAALAIVPLTK